MEYKAEIPYGAYWSTPFCKWQQSFANLHAMKFAAHVARDEMAKRSIDPAVFDFGVLGMTVPQKHSFYGLPWVMGMAGAGEVGGPTIAQACATSARCLQSAVQEIETGGATTAMVMTCDRVSNGPNIYYPNPAGPGGTGDNENWTLGNMQCDPAGNHSMTETAENVAKKYQITTAQQHDVVLRRQEQYADAVSDDHAFHKKYMTLPFAVPHPGFRKNVGELDGDEGIIESTAEGLAGLKPVIEDGTVTFGGQTHPADGSAAMVLTTADRAKELASDPKIRVQVLGFGLSRAALAYMPEAPIPAAKRALEAAGLDIGDMDAVKTHNPFAVNDIIFAHETGYDLDAMNNFGCSLIWGHPQGPTGLRSIIELIEELALRGGGTGLFTGCAAGDTAMACIINVSER